MPTDRVKAAAGGPATRGPTREQVAETVREVMRRPEFGSVFAGTPIADRLAYTRALTDRLLALFGRSAPEPPADIAPLVLYTGVTSESVIPLNGRSCVDVRVVDCLPGTPIELRVVAAAADEEVER